MTKKIVRVWGDDEKVVASSLPDIDAAEAVQLTYIRNEKDGADYYIEDED